MRVTKAEVKYVRSLSQKKVRQEERKFVVEGWRALKELINSTSKIEIVAVLPRYLEDPDYSGILSQLQQRGATVKELAESDLKAVADTVHAQGVIAVVQQKLQALDAERLQRASIVVAADAVGDPGNLGSIVRSSDWFNVDVVLLGRGCVDLYNDKVVRSTVGSIFHVPIVEGVDLPTTFLSLREHGFSIIAFSGDGKQSYTDILVDGKVVFVFGNEAHGISREVHGMVDSVVRIPKYGKAESLNVGVACGIVLAHVRAQREQKKGA